MSERKRWLNDTRRVEIMMPSRMLWMVAKHMAGADRGAATKAEGLDVDKLLHRARTLDDIAASFAASFNAALTDLQDSGRRKLAARMSRAIDVALAPFEGASGIEVLMVVHHLTQTLIWEDLWEPDQTYLAGYGAMSDLVQTEETEAIIDAADAPAPQLAAEMLKRLKDAGYYTAKLLKPA
jgi:hypothetical protein